MRRAVLGRCLLATLTATATATVGACAPARGDEYLRAVAAASRAKAAGRYGEAAGEYETAASVAAVPRDGHHAHYLAAQMHAAAGDRETAARELRAIATASPTEEDSAEASYELAQLAFASTGGGEGESAGTANADAGASEAEEDGWRALEGVVRHFPSSGIAARALRRIVHHDLETAGAAEAQAHLKRLGGGLEKTEIGELLAYERASLIAEQGALAEARDAYLAVASRWPYPRGALWDDALFRASELDEKLGHYDAAVADLERMVRERETSSIVGSYQRLRFTPAMVRIGALYRDRLHDRARAIATFRQLEEDFTTSEARDDALWEEAALMRDALDTSGACERLETLPRDYPDSRYVPCVPQVCPALAIASAGQKQDGGRERTCHPYLLEKRLGRGE